MSQKIRKKEATGKGVRREAHEVRSSASKGAIAGGLNLKASSSEAKQPLCEEDGERLLVHYSRDPGQQPGSLFADPQLHGTLRRLVLVGQAADTLCGVGRLARLAELWLVESQLRDASAARDCPLLEKLVLSTNRLRHVPDLAPLSRLTTLWLPGNRITTITNLSQLPVLEDVNLADNLITTIRGGLSGCKRLSVLNLSGNPLTSLKEASHLFNARSLRALSLADPVYGVTPMSRLCNYRSCVLLHLPHLQSLDGFSVEPAELAQLQEFYAKGARHMSMLRRHAEARYLQAVRLLGRAASADLQRFREQCFHLGLQQCELQHQRAEELNRQLQSAGRPAQPYAPSALDVDENTERLLEDIAEDMARWTEDLNSQMERHKADYEMSFARLECELESAGNVAMNVHNQDSRLADICQELLDRFSCDAQLTKWCIKRARVLRVTHVCSRGTEAVERWRPAELAEQVEQEEQEGAEEPQELEDDAECGAGPGASGEQQGDCESSFQLLCCPAHDLSFGPWPLRSLDFPALGVAKEPLLVTNCLALADSQWLQRRPARLASVRRLAPLVRLTRGTRLRSVFRSPGTCGTYRVLGPRPELLFLVEFQYEGLEDEDDEGGGRRGRTREVRIPAAVKHPVLDETLLFRCVVCPNWNLLTSVSLAGRGIKVLGELPVLPSVSDLDLSYNQLASLGSLYAFPNLRNLNLAFNNFVTLVNMRNLPALETLDLSWNSIRQLLLILRSLYSHAAGLRCLQMCHNPVEDVLEAAHGRHLALRYLPRLTVLDGKPLHRGAGSAVFLESPLGPQHASQTPRHRPATVLRLRWQADSGDQQTVLQPDRQTLCARGRGLTDILRTPLGQTPVTWLSATRWADLGDNLLGESGLCQALAAMPNLQQLSLARNTIEVLPPSSLQYCPALQRLDVSRNYLQAFAVLPNKSLQSLQFLDLSCNLLQSLGGLEELTGLQELYLANNRVRALQDLQPLKRLQKLCVLDMTGNEVSADANFRKFVVFHLRSLESVNGQEVVDGDLVSARETFGGCLDSDVLLTRYAWKDLTHLTEIYLPNNELRQVDLPGQLLPHLEVLDLSHNDLCRMWGLHQLPRLSVLDLGHNKVRTLRGQGEEVGEVFPALHTLFLDHNHLSSLQPLFLGSLLALRTLFLQNNQLHALSDLGHTELKGLVLDGNYLDGAALAGAAKAGLLRAVSDLHLDCNLIAGLDFLSGARRVNRLFLAKNKIADADELERLVPLCLGELTLLGNPVCLRPRHYAQIKELLPQLALFDGHPMDPERYLPYPTPQEGDAVQG